MCWSSPRQCDHVLACVNEVNQRPGSDKLFNQVGSQAGLNLGHLADTPMFYCNTCGGFVSCSLCLTWMCLSASFKVSCFLVQHIVVTSLHPWTMDEVHLDGRLRFYSVGDPLPLASMLNRMIWIPNNSRTNFCLLPIAWKKLLDSYIYNTIILLSQNGKAKALQCQIRHGLHTLKRPPHDLCRKNGFLEHIFYHICLQQQFRDSQVETLERLIVTSNNFFAHSKSL